MHGVGQRAKKRRRRRREAIVGLGVGGLPASAVWGNDHTTAAVCAAAGAAAHSASSHPGTGNYPREPWMHLLVRQPLGNDRLRWSAFERAFRMKDSAATAAMRCTPEAFEGVARTLGPYLSLPRRVLRGQWRGVGQAKIKTYDELCIEAGRAGAGPGARFRGGGYSQTPEDRLYTFWMLCRRPGALASLAATASYSPATVGRDLDAVSGAIIQGLSKPHGDWPSPGERDRLWKGAGSALKDYIASRKDPRTNDYFDVGRVCCSTAMDGCAYKMGVCPMPTDEAAHYCHKYGLKRATSTLYYIDHEGRIAHSDHGAPGSWVDVRHLRATVVAEHPGRFFRRTPTSDVSDITLGDGIFVGIGGVLDDHFLVPPRAPFTSELQSDQYRLHRHYRAISENVPGQLKLMFPIVDTECRMHYRLKPQIERACVLLYNAVKEVDGFLAEDRYTWLFG